MKPIFFFFFFSFCFSISVFGQDTYWQQDVKYQINASLDDRQQMIKGSEVIIYTNNSPTELSFIWFHLWPNAYDKSKNTALYAQLKKDRKHRKLISSYDTGFIDSLNFQVNGKSAKIEAHPEYIDIVKIILPSPLRKGSSVKISTSFRVKLPNFFSRSGYSDNEYMACQWYPKPAVFDKDGWHPFPYLDMGEFYSEYGSYDVKINVPSAYVVAATGTLQTEVELQKYKELGIKNVTNRNYDPLHYVYTGLEKTKTLHFKADSVPDFAWFASKYFIIHYAPFILSSGRNVDAFSFYFLRTNTPWINSIDYIKDATIKYSNWIGDYAYPTVQAVEGPSNLNSGGMEYPMITLITDSSNKPASLDGVITHEVGHNWFMSMLGSNERKHPWQDEGLNTYFELRYEAAKYRENSVFGNHIPKYLKEAGYEDFQSNTYGVMARIAMRTPIETATGSFKNNDDYALSSYVKPALWLYRLQQSIGEEGVNNAFRNYFNDWKFKHPTPADMKSSFEKSVGFNLDAWFSLLNYRGGI